MNDRIMEYTDECYSLKMILPITFSMCLVTTSAKRLLFNTYSIYYFNFVYSIYLNSANIQQYFKHPTKIKCVTWSPYIFIAIFNCPIMFYQHQVEYFWAYSKNNWFYLVSFFLSMWDSNLKEGRRICKM